MATMHIHYKRPFNLLEADNSVRNTDDIFHTVLNRFPMLSAFYFPSTQL